MSVVTFDGSSTTWTCPAGCTLVTKAEAWGPGGLGGQNWNGGVYDNGGGGGGGGGHSIKLSIPVTPGSIYTVHIASDGSYFISALTVFAPPGSNGGNSTPFAGGLGGTGGTGGVGDTVVNGNDGLDGGVGGGSGSSGGDGGNSPGGGSGGTGGSASDGGDGSDPGGGGGGSAGESGSPYSGGGGGFGRVELTFSAGGPAPHYTRRRHTGGMIPMEGGTC